MKRCYVWSRSPGGSRGQLEKLGCLLVQGEEGGCGEPLQFCGKWGLLFIAQMMSRASNSGSLSIMTGGSVDLSISNVLVNLQQVRMRQKYQSSAWSLKVMSVEDPEGQILESNVPEPTQLHSLKQPPEKLEMKETSFLKLGLAGLSFFLSWEQTRGEFQRWLDNSWGFRSMQAVHLLSQCCVLKCRV